MMKGRLVYRDVDDWVVYHRDETMESHQIGVIAVRDEDCELLTRDYNNLEIHFEMVAGKAKIVFNVNI